MNHLSALGPTSPTGHTHCAPEVIDQLVQAPPRPFVVMAGAQFASATDRDRLVPREASRPVRAFDVLRVHGTRAQDDVSQTPRDRSAARANSGISRGLRVLHGVGALPYNSAALSTTVRDMANAGTRLYVEGRRLAEDADLPARIPAALKLARMLGGLRAQVMSMQHLVEVIRLASQGADVDLLTASPREVQLARNSAQQAIKESARLRQVLEVFLRPIVAEVYTLESPDDPEDAPSVNALNAARQLDDCVKEVERVVARLALRVN